MSLLSTEKWSKHFSVFRVAYVVLLISAIATGWVHYWAQKEILNRQEASFQQAVSKFQHIINLHFSAYFNTLNGLKAFCAFHKQIAPAEFEDFLEIQGIRKNHPGMFDMGYIDRVQVSQREAFIQRMSTFGLTRRDLPEFPRDNREYYVMTEWDNFKDHSVSVPIHIFTEPERIEAMNKARDSGEIACSDRLDVYMGNDKLATNGFILYAAVYKKGASIKTVEERRQAISGFVFASFFIPDCWGAIYHAAAEPTVDFEVYDGSGMGKEKLWFDSCKRDFSLPRKALFTNVQPIANMGRDWTICCSSLPAFEDRPELKIPKFIFGGGLALSGVLFLLTLTQVRARGRMEALAGELQAASETMAAEKERLAVTLSSINEGVVTVDTNNRVVLMNRAAEEQTGFTLSAAYGNQLDTLFVVEDPQSPTPVACPVQEVLRTGKVWHSPKILHLRPREGPGGFVSVTTSPMRDVQGGILGVVVVFRDVTERQKLLEEQIKSSKLESIGVLAGGIAHDFNNILTTIMGNVSLAAMEAEDRPELLAFLKEADLGCGRARDLTQQLLTFAKGGAPIRKTAILDDVIRDSARFATHGAAARCECHLPADMWPVEADKGQISQVIHNMVINASQAMPSGGIIEVCGQNHNLEGINDLGLSAGRYVKITVQDHGMGIRPEHLDKIFDPYFSTKQRGSGLGLATAYSIVRRHEGIIIVDSKLGEGTRFDIYLPASDNTPALAAAVDKPPAVLGKGRILVMDDERPVLNLLVTMLEKLGYEVIPSMDGAEAVRLYAEAKTKGEAIAAVVLDLTVPGGVGGQQAMTQLLGVDPNVKAIVSSGYSNDRVMANYRDFGFLAVVPKPYGIETLTAALTHVVVK